MMKETILTGWTFMRVLRLVLGGFIVVNSFTDHNYVFTFLGGLFVFQAITNTGCASCAAVPSTKVEQKDSDFVEFEEVK